MTSNFQAPLVGTTPSRSRPNSTAAVDDIAIDVEPPRKPDTNIKHMLKALIPASILILVTFWISSAHLYGIFLRQGNHIQRAKVAIANFDHEGGSFGRALEMAAQMNSAMYGQPTYVNIDASQTSPERLRESVFDGTYWAAIYVEEGATERFDTALNGSAGAYDPTRVYTYILLSGRYYTLYVSTFQTAVLTVVNTASSIFGSETVVPLLSNSTSPFNTSSTVAAQALAHPIQAVSLSAAPQDFASLDDKPFLNTVGTVFPILLQFFFIMAWNGICNGLHLYAAYDTRTHILLRLFWSTFWPLLSSLCVSGWTFAFRGPYAIDAKMFFAYWTVTWVFCIINFDFLDILTGFLPMAFVPLVFLMWIIFNVAASLGPETLLNQWYRVSYAFPSLHWYQTVVTILSQGGVNRLYYTLPTLAGWLVLLKVVSPFATRARVRKATQTFLYLDEKDALEVPH